MLSVRTQLPFTSNSATSMITFSNGTHPMFFTVPWTRRLYPPVPDPVINSTFNITGGVIKSHSEDKILNVQISINNSNWINISYWEISVMDYEWYYIFNTTIYPNGNYDISIKAVGETYEEIIKTIMVEIEN